MVLPLFGSELEFSHNVRGGGYYHDKMTNKGDEAINSLAELET